jgi:hypothetical protein
MRRVNGREAVILQLPSNVAKGLKFWTKKELDMGGKLFERTRKNPAAKFSSRLPKTEQKWNELFFIKRKNFN